MAGSNCQITCMLEPELCHPIPSLSIKHPTIKKAYFALGDDSRFKGPTAVHKDTITLK